MGYQNNILHEHDVIWIRDCQFEIMNDFNSFRDKGIQLRFLRRSGNPMVFFDKDEFRFMGQSITLEQDNNIVKMANRVMDSMNTDARGANQVGVTDKAAGMVSYPFQRRTSLPRGEPDVVAGRAVFAQNPERLRPLLVACRV